MTSVTLITGATGGIGQPLCRRLASSGHRLVMLARNEDRLRALCASLEQPELHLVVPADMGHPAAGDVLENALVSHHVTLAGVVLMPPQPHAAQDPLPEAQIWRDLFERSFIGPLAVLGAAITQMRPDPAAGRRCKIAIVSGISSVQVLSHYATANVIRTAWVGQAKTLAMALGPQGIHVNTLSLGGTLSPWYRTAIERRAADAGVSFEERLCQETDNVPLGKYGTPEEVAVAVETLLGAFTDQITGVNITHDGGFTRAY